MVSTSINTHLTLLLQRSTNILVEDLRRSSQSGNGLNIVGGHNDVNLSRLAGVQDVGSEILNLGLDIVGAGDTKDLEAAIVDLLAGSWDDGCESSRGQQGRGKKSGLHCGIDEATHGVCWSSAVEKLSLYFLPGFISLTMLRMAVHLPPAHRVAVPDMLLYRLD